MLVKKYIVKNINEGIAKIKFELGSNAIVISQRKIRQKGIKGFFLPKVIEITAVSEGGSIDRINKDNLKNEIALNKKLLLNKTKRINENKLLPQDKLVKEMADMKRILENMSKQKNGIIEEEQYKNYINFLQDKDIPEDFISSIIQVLKEKLEDNNEELNKELIKEILREKFQGKLCESENIYDGVIAFVGPTGVGKTTTIAKLAGKYTLMHKKKVGLITVDTYRIGAVEQLKTYAEIMDIPFKVVFDIREMEETIESMSDCDTIFLDTTGRSYKNLMQLQELKAYVCKSKAKKVFLVLSSTTKQKDISSIIEGYKIMSYDGLIITKLDETSAYGSLLSIIGRAEVPLTYITTGQNVPQDIKNINDNDLLHIILGEDNLC